MQVAVDYSPFWSTVAQIVPVFGIALVLELRSAASHWTSTGRLQRRIESVVHMVNALILVTIFPIALGELSRGRDHGQIGPGIVIVCLGVSFVVLVWQPVLAAAGRANIDAVFLLQRALPWSAISIERRRVNRALRRLARLIEEVEDLVELARTVYLNARDELSAKGRLASSADHWFRQFAGGEVPGPEYEKLVGRSALLEAVTAYDLRPTAAGARRLREMKFRSGTRLFARARLQHAEVLAMRSSLLESLDRLQRGRLSSAELEMVEANISRASEAVLAPWPLTRT